MKYFLFKCYPAVTEKGTGRTRIKVVKPGRAEKVRGNRDAGLGIHGEGSEKEGWNMEEDKRKVGEVAIQIEKGRTSRGLRVRR